MILQLSDFLNQFLIVLIGGLNKEEFFFFKLDFGRLDDSWLETTVVDDGKRFNEPDDTLDD